MNFFSVGIIAILLSCYFLYNNTFYDIYENFGVYFPFLSISVYLDLFKYVLLPKFRNLYSTEILFTKEQLSQYDGKQSKYLYLSILGKIFDVSSADSYYGVGKTYNVFTGRDATRAFITGDFSADGLCEQIIDLPLQDLIQLKEWLKMYEEKYKYKGKLIGAYYSRDGYPTKYHEIIKNRFIMAGDIENSAAEEKEKFPPCNVEWSPEKGSRVWCSVRSGGIERDWVGVPRKLFSPRSKSYRCACMNTVFPEDKAQLVKMSRYISEYPNCNSKSYSCFVKTS